MAQYDLFRGNQRLGAVDVQIELNELGIILGQYKLTPGAGPQRLDINFALKASSGAIVPIGMLGVSGNSAVFVAAADRWK
jgi:hypothetical protein